MDTQRTTKINSAKYHNAEKAALGGRRGGWRPGSGRPAKTDKEKWGQITCVLKRATIEQLRAGAASKHFGEFLQFHLDNHPLPSREVYLALVERRPIFREFKKRKVAVLVSTGSSKPVRIRRIRRS